MSRLSEAMRRAAEGRADDGALSGDSTHAAGRENATGSPGSDVESSAGSAPHADGLHFAAREETPDEPELEGEPLPHPGPLAPRPRTVPIEVTRHESREDVEIRDVLRMLFRRWKLILTVVAVSLGAAEWYNDTATRVYEARARLLIEPDSPNVMPFRPVTEGTGRYDYYLTQLEVLRSRALARQTLERLGLLSDDPKRQPGQIGQLMGSLTVSPIRSEQGESRVVNVRVRSGNPEYAARMANAIAQTYVDQNLETRRMGSREASKWLNERLTELRREMTSSAGALHQYRERNDAVSLDNQQNIVVQKLAQLNSAVTDARAEKVEKETLYQQLDAIQRSGAALDTFPPILSNGFIQGLKGELGVLQRQRIELAEKLGDLHPDMIKVNAAIATAERRLTAEMDKVVEGIRNDFKAAEARERGLVAALEEQKREVLDLNQKAVAYGALQRDAASTQQIFDTVLQRLKETELSGELQANNARILDAAEVPRAPILPRTRLNFTVALFAGAVLALGLVIGLEYLNPRIAKPSDVADALGLPLLGIAPRVSAFRRGRQSIHSLPPAFQEALRSIRTRILLSPTASTARTLAVTSTGAGEGKTVIASTLAMSMASAGRRVLLVDADLRRSQLHRLFDMSRVPGLSNVMAGTAKPSEALVESSIPGLFVLPSGDDATSPSDLLDTDRLKQLIHGFSQIFDIVVLDCPPVLAVADAAIIGNAASSVVFVVGAGTTSRDVAQAAIDRLASVQVEVIGVVLNKVKSGPRAGYYYYAHDVARRPLPDPMWRG